MIIGYENGRHKISFSVSSDPDQHPYEETRYFTLRSLRSLRSELDQIFSKILQHSIRVYDQKTFNAIIAQGRITYKHSSNQNREPRQGDILSIGLVSSDNSLIKQTLFEIDKAEPCYNSERGGFDYLLEISEL